MARDALTEVGLSGLFDRLPSEVSGGEEQRAAIARALVMRPKLLLCDEPTGSLDPENEAIVLTLFQKLVERGTALIIVTHNPNVAAFCDRSLRLRAGRLAPDE